MKTAGAITAALVIAAVVSAPAAARRAPTVAERAEIRGAMALALSFAPPVCYGAVIYVSTVDRRYAYATARWKTIAKCLPYASNGYFILRRSTHWRVVFNGSDAPPCTRVPARVARDLIKMRCR